MIPFPNKKYKKLEDMIKKINDLLPPNYKVKISRHVNDPQPHYIYGIPPPPSKDSFSDGEWKKRYKEWHKKLEEQIKQFRDDNWSKEE